MKNLKNLRDFTIVLSILLFFSCNDSIETVDNFNFIRTSDFTENPAQPEISIENTKTEVSAEYLDGELIKLTIDYGKDKKKCAVTSKDGNNFECKKNYDRVELQADGSWKLIMGDIIEHLLK